MDLPDGRSQRVVLKEVNQSATLTYGGAATSWDCHIAMIPDLFRSVTNATGVLATTSLSQTSCFPNYVSGVSSNTVGGGLAYAISDGGVPTYTGVGAANVSSLSPWAHVTGRSRIVGCAFEVHNVTETLYRSGSVITYRTATGREFDALGMTATSNTAIGVNARTVVQRIYLRKSTPPSTEAEAILIPSSRQWGAEKGCYVVCVLDDVEATYRTWDTMGRLYTDPFAYSASLPTAPANCLVLSPTMYTSNAGADVTPTYTFQSFDTFLRQSGAYFTGLSPQSKLKLNVKWLIACQPDIEDPLLPLAMPGPPRDDLALEIYSRAAEALPAGVPVAENGAGDWFRSVLGTVADVAPMVGSLFGPAGSALGQGIGMAAKAGRSLMGGQGAARELQRVNAATKKKKKKGRKDL